MGLSSFPVASKGLWPLLLMNTALLVSYVKSTWRSVLRAIAGGAAAAAEAEARDPAPRGGGAAGGRVRVKRFKTVRREMSASASECGCSCCVCRCWFKAEEVSELDCKHFFHRECLERWFENDHRTCPLCRSILLKRKVS